MNKTLQREEDRNTATISLGDFMRIRNNIIPQEKEEEEMKKSNSKLSELSKSKMRGWADSLEMAKKNKLDQIKKRFIEKEVIFFKKQLEKRKIDEEEYKYQEAQKKVVVERAKKILFENQDRVKSLNSALLISDTLKVVEK